MTNEEKIAKSITILDSYKEDISEYVYEKVLWYINVFTEDKEDNAFVDEKEIKGRISIETDNENKPATWTEEQDVKYETAEVLIEELKSIFSRLSYRTDDEEKKEIYRQRRLELHREKAKFNGFDDDIVKDVTDTYSPLVREYYEMKESETEIAQMGLPEKFWTTKVDYGKYGRD